MYANLECRSECLMVLLLSAEIIIFMKHSDRSQEKHLTPALTFPKLTINKLSAVAAPRIGDHRRPSHVMNWFPEEFFQSGSAHSRSGDMETYKSFIGHTCLPEYLHSSFWFISIDCGSGRNHGGERWMWRQTFCDRLRFEGTTFRGNVGHCRCPATPLYCVNQTMPSPAPLWKPKLPWHVPQETVCTFLLPPRHPRL